MCIYTAHFNTILDHVIETIKRTWWQCTRVEPFVSQCDDL
jgi:hypothetical protein